MSSQFTGTDSALRQQITELTPVQRERLAPFAAEWIENACRTTPLTEDEWAVVEDGMRRCYEYAGIDWPGRVVRVASPAVGAVAAATAAYQIAARERALAGAATAEIRSAAERAVLAALDGGGGRAPVGFVRESITHVVAEPVATALNQAIAEVVSAQVVDAVGQAVEGAVEIAVGQPLERAIWYRRPNGHVVGGWVGSLRGRTSLRWRACAAFFRDVVEVELDGDLWDRCRAFDDAQGAGWWWPHADFVLACEPPTIVKLEPVPGRPERTTLPGFRYDDSVQTLRSSGSRRLHREDGPALAWSDGFGLYFWRGIQVPAWVIESPSMEKAMAERNSEIRRCAFESLGWGSVLSQLGADPIDVCPDPANPPHELKLYQLPEHLTPHRRPLRLLVMINGSPDRSGALRTYAEAVPDSVTSAAQAAAWQYGLAPHVYKQLERRT